MAVVRKRSRILKPIPWYVAYQEIEPYVVKIMTPQGSGTGFLVLASEKQKIVGIATAAHVVYHPNYWELPIRIYHPKSGKTVFLGNENRVINIYEDQDVAAILFTGGKLPFPDKLLPLIAEDKHLKVGVEIGWLGFPALAAEKLCFFSGSISCWIGKDKSYLVDGVAINGVSGGPAFSITTDNRVQLIGVVSAYIPNRATGAQLPGLCEIRDVEPLYETIKDIKNFEDARKQGKIPTPPPSVTPTVPPATPAPDKPSCS